MTSPIGGIIEGARRAVADLQTERATDPLFGRRSPLGYADEAEPFFTETLNDQQFPWYPTGTPFPSLVTNGEVTVTVTVDPPPAIEAPTASVPTVDDAA